MPLGWGGGVLRCVCVCDCIMEAPRPPVSLCKPHTGISLSVSLLTRPRTLSSFFFSFLPLLLCNTGVSLSRVSFERCGVFVRPDKGCHSSPFPLLCGPGLAAPVEVQMLYSRRGYPRGPQRFLSLSLSLFLSLSPSLALSLPKAGLITTLPPPLSS